MKYIITFADITTSLIFIYENSMSLYLIFFFWLYNHWLQQSFSWQILSKGWIKSAQLPWNLRNYLKRYSGFKYLAQEDLDYIISIFGPLIYIAYGNGTVLKDYIKEVLKEWIYDLPKHTLSLDARFVLALDELKSKPITSASNATNQGTVILTNPGWRTIQKEVAKAAIETKLDKLRAGIAAKEEEARKVERGLISLNIFITYAKADILAGTFDNIDSQWRKGQVGGPKIDVALIKEAYFVLVPEASKSMPRPTTKSGWLNEMHRFLKIKVTG